MNLTKDDSHFGRQGTQTFLGKQKYSGIDNKQWIIAVTQAPTGKSFSRHSHSQRRRIRYSPQKTTKYFLRFRFGYVRRFINKNRCYSDGFDSFRRRTNDGGFSKKFRHG